MVVDAAKVTGAVVQKGKLIVRPEHAVFAPTEASVNVAARLAGAAAGLAAGFVVRHRPGRYPDTAAYIDDAVTASPADFDAEIAAVAAEHDWWRATPADARVLFKKVWLFSRYKLSFRRGEDHVGMTFGLAKDLVPRVEPLLQRWPRV